MHRGQTSLDPWSGKMVTAVTFRGTEFLSRTPIMADTSFSGAKAYFNKLAPGTASAVYQLLEDKKADVFALDGHSLGGFAAGEFLADLITAAKIKWKDDPARLNQFLGKIDFSTINSIGYSSRAIEAMEYVTQAGGKVRGFYQPDDYVRKIPSTVGGIAEKAKVLYTSGVHAPTAEEYQNATLFDIPEKYATKLVMPDGIDITYNISAHRINAFQSIIKDAMSINQTRKSMEQEDLSVPDPHLLGSNLKDKRNKAVTNDTSFNVKTNFTSS